jgi:periplasmic copper chaperone A
MVRILSLLVLFFLSGNGIVIKDQWLRPGAEKMATALYFTIENSSDSADTLYAVESDISSMIQMHETYSQGDMMGMREIKELIIEPGSEIRLEPGGNHIMVMKLKKDLKKGETIKFILHLKHAGEIPIIAEVKE